MANSLRYLLEEKHDVEWRVKMCVKANVPDYNLITTEDFITNYNVRQMLKWRNFGNVYLSKLAEVFDKEKLSLRF